jgi:hypothetical protein
MQAEVDGRRDTGLAEATRLAKPALIELAQLKAGFHTSDDSPIGPFSSRQQAEAVAAVAADRKRLDPASRRAVELGALGPTGDGWFSAVLNATRKRPACNADRGVDR